MEVYIVSLIVLLLVVLATIIRFFGGEMLIAGYNTSSPEERAYMKEKGIGKFVGNYMYGLAAIILAGFLLKKVGVPYAQDISWLVFVVVIVVMLIRARQFNPPGPPSPQRRRSLWLTLVIVVVVAVVVTWNAIPANIEMEEEQVTISGAYGTSFKYADIDQVQLLEELPEISLRTNGISLGPINKGHFKLEDGGSVLLFLRNGKPPFIHITFNSDQKPIIINAGNPESTNQLFQELSERVD
ncbi:MAG TPA: DUF3784 domain-containing protein [Syntrophomonadaceae bacterium]|nr:DUF3784 domain-containing protein [Syntrophomonadaceae bacterium]HQD91434.1 DUF3784 domain-containing protein [Syntrophomonadaceae bacterium]